MWMLQDGRFWREKCGEKEECKNGRGEGKCQDGSEDCKEERD